MNRISRHRTRAVVIAFLAGVLCPACAFTPQSATLKPAVAVSTPTIGEGKSVYVQVSDERPETEFGRRGSGALRGAAIGSSQNVAAVFRDAIVQGLNGAGFETTTTPGDSRRSLKVAVREIKYDTSMGFFTGGIHTNAAIKAEASNGSAEYENFYRAENEDRVLVVPTASSNEDKLNIVVNSVLDQMFSDRALLDFLASD